MRSLRLPRNPALLLPVCLLLGALQGCGLELPSEATESAQATETNPDPEPTEDPPATAAPGTRSGPQLRTPTSSRGVVVLPK